MGRTKDSELGSSKHLFVNVILTVTVVLLNYLNFVAYFKDLLAIFDEPS
jgi:hypothetical protein